MADEQPTQPAPDPQAAEAAQPAPVEAVTPPPAVVTPDPQQLAGDFKKEELQTTAQVLGADVPSGATKSDIAQAIVEAQPVAPVTMVDSRTRRSEDDAMLGSWVDVISGPDQGRFGAYVDTVHHDPQTGYPSVILIRSRDARNELLEVSYSDVRPSERTGGR
jgi:hypothetical protein